MQNMTSLFWFEQQKTVSELENSNEYLDKVFYHTQKLSVALQAGCKNTKST